MGRGASEYFQHVVNQKALDGLTMEELCLALDKLLFEFRRRGIVVQPSVTFVGECK